MTETWDLVIAGGGLAGGLLAYRLQTLRPEMRILVCEAESTAGGTHTWSFHPGDVSPEALVWLSPFVRKAWERHEVIFPGLARTLDGGYLSISSARFHSLVGERLGDALRLGSRVTVCAPGGVVVDGEQIRARAVIDARGFPEDGGPPAGYQKFLGLELECAEPHGLEHPILMDATCAQTDGFRFFYTLPWSDHELLVEDTHYSDGPALDRDAYRREILAYADRRGWKVKAVRYQEVGILPIPLEKARASREDGVARLGARAGLFHPTTGYSLPDAVAAVEKVSALCSLDHATIRRTLAAHARRAERGRRFYRFLNRMLFRGAEPAQRYRVLERFYRLPEPLIARFYAMRLEPHDYVRLLVGKPPIPVGRALACVFGRGSYAHG